MKEHLYSNRRRQKFYVTNSSPLCKTADVKKPKEIPRKYFGHQDLSVLDCETHVDKFIEEFELFPVFVGRIYYIWSTRGRICNARVSKRH